MPKKLSIGKFGYKSKPYEDDEYPVKVERKLMLCLTPEQREFLLWGVGYLRGRSFSMDKANQRYIIKHSRALLAKLTHLDD